MKTEAAKQKEETTAPAAEPQHAPEKGKLWQLLRGLLPLKNDTSFREAIEELIEEESDSPPESTVALHERRLITNILQLRDLAVVDIMVPRADIVAIDVNTSRDELLKILTQKPHSRIPAYRKDPDNIVGMIHMKDIVSSFSQGKPFELKDILREVLVVSPAMRVLDLLLQMRQSRVHIAMVIDEFGGIDGLLTINDLVEAIVGEIDDDYGFEVQPQMIERPDGSILADARFPIGEFEKKYGEVLTDEEREEADTLGGLVNTIAGRVPIRGEILTHTSGIEFEIIDGDPRRVTRLRLRNLPAPKPVEAAE